MQALDVDMSVLDDEEAAGGDEVGEALERRSGDLTRVGRVLDYERPRQRVDLGLDRLDRLGVSQIALDQRDLLPPFRVGAVEQGLGVVDLLGRWPMTLGLALEPAVAGEGPQLVAEPEHASRPTWSRPRSRCRPAISQSRCW